MKTWQKVGLAAILIYGIFVNLYLAIFAACRDCVAIVAQTNYVAHYVLLFGASFFIGFLLFHFRRFLWAMFLPSVLAFGVLYLPLFIPKSEPDAEGQEITAASFNVLRHHEDQDDIIAVIEDFDADIIGLFELDPEMPEKLQAELSDEYSHQVTWIEDGYEGLGLLSRYPILEESLVMSEQDLEDVYLDEQRHARILLDVEGHPIAVYLVHPPIADVTPVLAYDDTYLQREVEGAIEDIEQEQNPMIMMCDCNSSPLTRQHAQFDEVLNDAFEKHGYGLGLSFKGLGFSPIPILRIDYIWYSDAFVVKEVKVWEDAGSSDHKPIWAKLILVQGDATTHGQQTVEYHAGNVYHSFNTSFYRGRVQYSGHTREFAP